jgi:hypothetical protein
LENDKAKGRFGNGLTSEGEKLHQTAQKNLIRSNPFNAKLNEKGASIVIGSKGVRAFRTPKGRRHGESSKGADNSYVRLDNPMIKEFVGGLVKPHCGVCECKNSRKEATKFLKNKATM